MDLDGLNNFLGWTTAQTSIKEEEISLLQKTFCLEDKDKYIHWASVYYALKKPEEHSLDLEKYGLSIPGKDGQSKQFDLERIEQAIRDSKPRKVPFAPLFLLIGAAILAEVGKKPIKGLIDQWKDGEDNGEQEYRRLKKAVKTLLMEIANESPWISNHHRKTLRDIKAQIERERRGRVRVRKIFTEHFKTKISKSRPVGDHAPGAIGSHNGIVALLKTHGIKKGFHDVANKLFASVEVPPISRESAAKA